MNADNPTLFRKFINLLLYGNFWIALGALSLLIQTIIIYQGQFVPNPLAGFVFFGTLCLYALHRIVGISKAHEYYQLHRYAVITRYKSHIQVYAVIGGIGAGICFFLLKRPVQVAVILPTLLSLGYVLPVLGNKKRLRDLNDIKIFMVAGVWAWITVVLPATAYSISHSYGIVLTFIERFLFVFAITIPFDIRDLAVDGQGQVRTIPARLGIKKSKILSGICLLTAAGCAVLCWQLFYYSIPILIASLITYLISFGLIHATEPNRDDYFFTGWLDGTMILSGLSVFIANLFS